MHLDYTIHPSKARATGCWNDSLHLRIAVSRLRGMPTTTGMNTTLRLGCRPRPWHTERHTRAHTRVVTVVDDKVDGSTKALGM